MSNFTKKELLSDLKQQLKRNPPMPLAPIDRLIKEQTGRRTSEDASVELRDIFQQIAKDVISIANNFADVMDRKTINGKMIRKAYVLWKEQTSSK